MRSAGRPVWIHSRSASSSKGTLSSPSQTVAQRRFGSMPQGPVQSSQAAWTAYSLK